MLAIEDALAAVLSEVWSADAVPVPLAAALDLVIAEDVVSDVDTPPFDKALMDGYAVRTSDVSAGTATLRVVEELTAGRVPSRRVGPGEATHIMTGSPLPEGADAVVPRELSQFDQGAGTVSLAVEAVSSGMNIMYRGSTRRQGAAVISRGELLKPQHLGALAEIGKSLVSAIPKPRVAVIATGDELVPFDREPAAGQIRNSNEIMLFGQIVRAGAVPDLLGIAGDDRDTLTSRIQAGLESEVLLLSGGVSAGKMDLVPVVLESLGVRPVFHKVNLKPGKPVLFGVADASTATGRQRPSYVFALPGNPVSSMVCFELFARTAIRRLRGIDPADPVSVRARMVEDYVCRGDRPVFHPARLTAADSGFEVRLVEWQGSADLQSTIEANSMAFFAPRDSAYVAGQSVQVYPWDDLPGS